jgi:hypothetical protein
VFENRVLRRIFGTRGLRERHNEELHNLYSSPNIIRMTKSRRVRWAGHEWGEEECIYDIGGKARRKEPLGRTGRRCMDNIKMVLREKGWDIMD